MIVRERGNLFEIVDRPGMHWVLGLFFSTIGAVFAAAALGLSDDVAWMEWWIRATTVGLGFAAIWVGGWLILRAPRSTLRIDRSTGVVTLRRVGLIHSQSMAWKVGDLTRVHVVEKRDDEDGRIYQVQLDIRDREAVPLTLVWHHGLDPVEEVARRLAREVGAEVTSVR